MTEVRIDRLWRRFGATTAVADVSFEFTAGQVFGFIGPNGAGKTTTMRILAGLDEPSAGDCTLDGRSTVQDADLVARRIGYMPDDYGTYPHMTVAEYLDFFARAYGLGGDRRDAAVADVVDFCQLGDLREKLVTSLSKGMRQRLGLGRALVHDPDLLILDEPAAGLDPRARVELRQLIRLLARQGKAILVSSHILADLEEICDAVAIIELGRVVATGTVRDIKRSVQARLEDAAREAGEHVVVEVRLARPHAELARVLAEEPEIANVEIHDERVTLTCSADPDARAALLARLIGRGLAVSHFAARDKSLEDVFMHLTEGRVQ
ncbi:MAG: ABC transporter ATP-binding protein [Deltaproteobacteria bacterium]|nr:ABC transporter ATP-binding protein [Deltaproteobacteria bacterium]